jgi:predicted HTH domain antitoxin
MPLIISDETLEQLGLSAQDALVEFACRLFDAGRLGLWAAAQLAGLSRVVFENELRSRGIAIYRPKAADLEKEIKAMKDLGI